MLLDSFKETPWYRVLAGVTAVVLLSGTLLTLGFCIMQFDAPSRLIDVVIASGFGAIILAVMLGAGLMIGMIGRATIGLFILGPIRVGWKLAQAGIPLDQLENRLYMP